MSSRYVGGELELFARASNWKRYVGRVLEPFIGARVLEVGAGIGGNISPVASCAGREWTSLEPDPAQARRITQRVALGQPPPCRGIAGTLDRAGATAVFDPIIYTPP